MLNYLNLVEYILQYGESVNTRSGRCKKIFDAKLSFDLSEGFPIVTTKKIHFKSIVGELLWFLEGNTNIKRLNDNGNTIWNEWADENGDLGPIYGHQWRNLAIDQIQTLLDTIKKDPQSRRLIVDSWNVEQLSQMRLPPCHYAFECYVGNNKHLHLKWHQRSVDVMLGLPFNIASYALLLHIIALETELEPGTLIADLGNCHIYENHIQGALEQCTRRPYDSPILKINKKPIFDYIISDFALENYKSYDKINFEVAV